MLGHQLEKDFDDMFSRFDTISDRDRPTGQHSAANKKAMLSQGNLAMPRVSTAPLFHLEFLDNPLVADRRFFAARLGRS